VIYTYDANTPRVVISSPTKNEYVNNLVDIRGKVDDSNLVGWTLEYGVGTNPTVYNTLAYGNNNIPDNGLIYTWDTSSLVTNQVYTIRLQATDIIGQEFASYTSQTVIKGTDPDPIINRTLQVDSPYTYYSALTESLYSADSQTSIYTSEADFTYERNNDGGNQDLKGTIYINGQKAGEETQPGQGFNVNMLPYHDGTSDKYFIIATDSSGNTYYSCKTQCDKALYDILNNSDNIETLSNVVIDNGLLKLSTDENGFAPTGYFITKSIPISSSSFFQLILDNAVDLPDQTNIAYYYSTDNGLTWISFGSDRTILSNLSSIKIKGVLSSQNVTVSPTIDTIGVNALYFVNPTRIALHLVDAPSNLTVTSNVNHTILLRWEASDTEGATYNVYRSTSETGDYTAVATGLTQTYWYDYNLVYGQTFYYQVKAQAVIDGQLREDGWGHSAVPGTVVNENEIDKLIGNQPYSTFDGDTNVVSGNLYYQVTDFTQYTPGNLSLDMVRTYNSQATYNTALGYGWDFSFNICLLKEYDPSYQGSNPPEIGMILKEGDGTLYRFTKTAQNTYISPTGNYMELSCVNGIYKITTKGKTIYTFNNNLMVSRIVDRNGNALTFSYDTETGYLEEVSDMVGNGVGFTYDSDQMTFAGNGAITAKYEYNNVPITQAKLENISIWGHGNGGLQRDTYTYNQPGTLCTISDAAGNATTMEYTNGKVSKLTNPLGEAQTYLYNVNIADDTNNTITTFRNASTTYHYNTEGVVIKTTNPLGNYTEYQYDDNYNVTQTKYKNRVGTTDNVDIITSALYDANGNMLHSTDEFGYTTYYLNYNSFGDVGTVIQPFTDDNNDGTANTYVKQSFTYDPSTGNLLSSSKQYKGTYIGGSFTQIGDAVGMETAYTYDSFGNVLTKTTGIDLSNPNAAKSVTSYAYDTKGRLLTTTAPDGSVTGQHYNDAGYIDWTSDEEGAKTYYYYDIYGRKTSTVSPGQDATVVDDNVTDSYKYDKCDNIVRTDSTYLKNGSTHDDITLNEFDALGRTISTTTAAGTLDASKTKTIYGSADPQGNYTVTNKDPDGVATTTTYNAVGWTIKTDDGDSWTETQYDNCGQAIETDTNDGIVNVTQYDKLVGDRIEKWNKSISDYGDSSHKNQTTETSYDLLGNVIMSKDPKNIVTETTYDAASRTLEVKETDHSTSPATVIAMEYAYDMTSNGKYLTTVTDALGRETDYYYDQNGNLTKQVDEGDTSNSTEMVTQYSYDGKGNVLTETRPDGSVVSYDYYDDDSLKKTTYSSTFYIEYTYDSDGNEKSMTQTKDGVVTTREWKYDNQDRVKEIKQNGVILVKYEYTDNDSISAMKYPQSDGTYKVIGYSYDNENGGRLTSISDVTDEQHPKLIREYIYDNNGNLTSLRDYRKFDQANNDGDYTEQSFAYDTDGSLKSVNYTDKDFDGYGNLLRSVQREAYSLIFDANGNITEEDVTTNYGTSVSTEKGYEYDAFGRLVKEKVGGTTTATYGYDKVGNRTSLTTSSGTIYYDYNEFNELTRTASDQNFNNIRSTFSYDDRGNQTSETDMATSTLTSYDYDLADRLADVTKRVGQGSTETLATYSYDGNGQRISKQAGSSTTRYYYDDSQNLLYTDDGTSQRLEENLMEPDGSVFASKRFTRDYAGNYYFYRQDIRGSITSVVDKDGGLVVGQGYDAYGITERTPKSGDEDFVLSFAYTGAVIDYETGLYYMNARYYNPEMGSFLTRDTVEGQLAYAYCDGNPINNIDESGHIAISLNPSVYKYGNTTDTPYTITRQYAIGNSIYDEYTYREVISTSTGNYIFYHYPQSAKNPGWGNWFSSYTYAHDGCSATSMAMVLSSYLDEWITPDMIGKYQKLTWRYSKWEKSTPRWSFQAKLNMFDNACIAYGFTEYGYWDMGYSGTKDKVKTALKNGWLLIKRYGISHYNVIQCISANGAFRYFMRDNSKTSDAVGKKGPDDCYPIALGENNAAKWDVFWDALGFFIINPAARTTQNLQNIYK
jgi:RHS repeat-associated protein